MRVFCASWCEVGCAVHYFLCEWGRLRSVALATRFVEGVGSLEFKRLEVQNVVFFPFPP